MQPINNQFEGYLDRFKRPAAAAPAHDAKIPIRPRDKKTRLWIDNEYFTKRYAATFPKSVSLVYGVLCKYANAGTQCCWPTIPTIMGEAGIGSRETMFAAVKTLEAHRIIAVRRSKGRYANVYTLLDCAYWLPPNSADSRTVPDEGDGTVIKPQPYGNEALNGTETGTPIHKMKSEKEIMGNSSLEKEKMQKENAFEVKILSTLHPMNRILITTHFDPAEAEAALKNLANSGSIVAKLSGKELVDYLRESKVTATQRLGWM